MAASVAMPPQRRQASALRFGTFASSGRPAHQPPEDPLVLRAGAADDRAPTIAKLSTNSQLM